MNELPLPALLASNPKVLELQLLGLGPVRLFDAGENWADAPEGEGVAIILNGLPAGEGRKPRRQPRRRPFGRNTTLVLPGLRVDEACEGRFDGPNDVEYVQRGTTLWVPYAIDCANFPHLILLDDILASACGRIMDAWAAADPDRAALFVEARSAILRGHGPFNFQTLNKMLGRRYVGLCRAVTDHNRFLSGHVAVHSPDVPFAVTDGRDVDTWLRAREAIMGSPHLQSLTGMNRRIDVVLRYVTMACGTVVKPGFMMSSNVAGGMSVRLTMAGIEFQNRTVHGLVAPLIIEARWVEAVDLLVGLLRANTAEQMGGTNLVRPMDPVWLDRLEATNVCPIDQFINVLALPSTHARAYLPFNMADHDHEGRKRIATRTAEMNALAAVRERDGPIYVGVVRHLMEEFAAIRGIEEVDGNLYRGGLEVNLKAIRRPDGREIGQTVVSIESTQFRIRSYTADALSQHPRFVANGGAPDLLDLSGLESAFAELLAGRRYADLVRMVAGFLTHGEAV